MSALGHKQTSRDVRVTPALPPIADIRRISSQRIIEFARHLARKATVMATRFREYEPAPPPKPKHDRVVLMADQFGQVHYVDDGGVCPYRM